MTQPITREQMITHLDAWCEYDALKEDPSMREIYKAIRALKGKP